MDQLLKIRCKKCRERAIDEYKKEERRKKRAEKIKEKKSKPIVSIKWGDGVLSFD